MQIRKDLEADNNLKDAFRACAYCTAEPLRMAGQPGPAVQILTENRDAHDKSVKDGLTFRPLDRLDGARMRPEAGWVTLRMGGNELLVIEAGHVRVPP